MLWLRGSWFWIVTCDPRATVSACGQMALFMMTKVLGFALGVHEAEGAVLGDALPPHEMAMATAAAAKAPAARCFTFRMRVVSFSQTGLGF
jgi:hypothetical protein